MWRWMAPLAAIVFLAATCGSLGWAPSGLLLGLRRPCLGGQRETVYRTLWIARDRGFDRNARFHVIATKSSTEHVHNAEDRGKSLPWT